MHTTAADAGSLAYFSRRNEALHERIPALFRRVEDREYLLMQQAFRAAGGVVNGDQLAYLLRQRIEQPISAVARWIIGREVVSYEWCSQTMLPLFQFELPRVVLRSAVADVVHELRNVYTDRALAMWFVKSNSRLDGGTPIAIIETNPRAVLEAACADRVVRNE
jgi:hypothetical protein